MTIAEVHRAVKLVLDKSSALELPAFEPEEIDFWINNSQLKYLGKLIEIIKYSTNAEEKTAAEIKISTLIERVDGITVSPTATPNAHYISSTALPTTMYEPIKVFAEVSRTLEDGTTSTLQYTPCRFIKGYDVEQYIVSPFNRPYFENPVVLLESDGSTASRLRILADYYTTAIRYISMYYVKTPTSVNINTSVTLEFPSNVHQEIVDLTAMMMLENIESQRLQTFPLVTQ